MKVTCSAAKAARKVVHREINHKHFSSLKKILVHLGFDS